MTELYRNGESLYYASPWTKDIPICSIVLDDEGLHILHGHLADDSVELATAEESRVFDKALERAGLILFEDFYHALPCEKDMELVRTAMSMPYTRWTEKSELADRCVGTYAKEVIRRICITDNHREEASMGEI